MHIFMYRMTCVARVSDRRDRVTVSKRGAISSRLVQPRRTRVSAQPTGIIPAYGAHGNGRPLFNASHKQIHDDALHSFLLFWFGLFLNID